MTGALSSTHIPPPSVVQIDRSEYPFSSALFEPETTNGLGIRYALATKFQWSSRSELSYFEVVGNKGELYEELDVGNDAVAKFVYDTQRSPDIRIFFVADRFNNEKLSLTREAFIQLLEKTGVPPAFIEVYDNDNGALVGSPVYSDGDDGNLIAYQVLVKFPGNAYVTAAVYFCYNFSSRLTTCLVLGGYLDQLKHRFQELFPGDLRISSARPQQYPRDPFIVLSTMAAEYASIMDVGYIKLQDEFREQQDKTGMTAHLFDRSLPVSPSALPSRIKGLHLCDGRLIICLYDLDFQLKWVTFLQQQHLIVNELRRKLVLDGQYGSRNYGRETESIASQKVSASLALSASLLDNLSSSARMLSRYLQIFVSVAQSRISQFDSRTNISIAYDSTRIALDVKNDSVAMKTIAGLTMVFLPGTFAATVFSMVFFHVTDGPESRLIVNEHWWLYIAVTIPLTGLVLAAWLGWLRWKRRAMPKDAGPNLEDEEYTDMYD